MRYGFVALDESAVEHDTYVYQGLAAWLDANHEPCRRAKGADGARARQKSETRAWRRMRQPGRVRNDGTADANLEWALRCALATPEEWAKAGGNCDGFKLGGAPEKRARAALAAACAARLAEMETSVAEDEATLAGGDVRDRARASPCSTAWRRSGS